jgi:hypothetical protein
LTITVTSASGKKYLESLLGPRIFSNFFLFCGGGRSGFSFCLWRRLKNLSTILEYIYVEMSVLNEDRITGDRPDLRSRLDRLW